MGSNQREYLGQTPWCVRSIKIQRGFVGPGHRPGLPGPLQHQKAGVVVGVVVDGRGQQLQAESFGCLGPGHHGHAGRAPFGQQLGAEASIFGFNKLPLRVLGQKIATLAQGHRVRMHGLYVGQCRAGQRQQVLVDG